MQSALVDSGPLVALFDPSDNHHKTTLAFMVRFRESLLTTWPVVTEVCHLLKFSVDVQLNFLRWVQRGGVEIAEAAWTTMERSRNATTGTARRMVEIGALQEREWIEITGR